MPSRDYLKLLRNAARAFRKNFGSFLCAATIHLAAPSLYCREPKFATGEFLPQVNGSHAIQLLEIRGKSETTYRQTYLIRGWLDFEATSASLGDFRLIRRGGGP